MIFFIFPLLSEEQHKELSVFWDGSNFRECNLRQLNQNETLITGYSIYFAANHITCYGHALLDGVFPFYSLLKHHSLLNTPINIIIETNSHIERNLTFQNIIQLIKDIFQIRQVIYLNKEKGVKPLYFEKLTISEHVPLLGTHPRFYSFYQACPVSFDYIHALKKFGLADNVIFQDTNTGDNLVKEFVNYIKAAYKIDLPMVKNRILITHRAHCRRILNLPDLINTLKTKGYNPVIVDFEKMPIRQQIIETIQSEYLMGTYGSNLVNAIFLRPQASVVVLWHKYAKYFWSRKYCIIHSAFLSVGAKLIEYDQPNYNRQNHYPEGIHVPDFFYRASAMNVLRPEKTSLEAMLKYPLPAMYEITNVDLYIDPDGVIKVLESTR